MCRTRLYNLARLCRHWLDWELFVVDGVHVCKLYRRYCLVVRFFVVEVMNWEQVVFFQSFLDACGMYRDILRMNRLQLLRCLFVLLDVLVWLSHGWKKGPFV